MRYKISRAIAIAAGTALSASFAHAKCVNCPPIVPFTFGPNFTGTVGMPDSPRNPPDTMGAVGPTAVVELNNLQFSVYDKLGQGLLHSSLNDFWKAAGVTPLGDGAYDPRILYDKQSGRWIAVSADNLNGTVGNFGPNNVLVAVSNSSDPQGAWSGQSIAANRPGGATGLVWADFPRLGVTKDRVTIAADMYTVGQEGSIDLNAANVFSIPKVSLLAGQLSGLQTFVDAAAFGPAASQPVVDFDFGLTMKPQGGFQPPPPSVQPLIRESTQGIVRRDLVGIDAFSGSLGNAVSMVADATASFSAPMKAPQKGSSVSIAAYPDTRYTSSVVLQNGEFWAVRAINGHNGLAQLLWIRASKATNQVIQSGLISVGTLALYDPSIAINKSGDVVIGYSGSGPNASVGSYVVVGATVNGVTQFGALTNVAAGGGVYERGVDPSSQAARWGDYSATVVDPQDDLAFWTFQEFAPSKDTFATRVTEMSPLRLVALPKNVFTVQEIQNVSGQEANGLILASPESLRDVGVRGVELTGAVGSDGKVRVTFLPGTFGRPVADRGTLLVALDGPGGLHGVGADALSFTQDGVVLADGVEAIGTPPTIGVDRLTGDTFADFFNPNDFELHLSDVELLTGIDDSHLDLNDFFQPTGQQLANVPNSFDLFPHQTYRLSFGDLSFLPGTYALAMAHVGATDDPDHVFLVAAASDFSVPEPPTLFLIGLCIAGWAFVPVWRGRGRGEV